MSRVLLTGAAGFIGMHVTQRLLDAGHEVGGNTGALSADRDHRSERSPRRRRGLAFKPAAVLHAGAATDVDGCERDPETAWRVNVGGTLRGGSRKRSAAQARSSP